MRIEKQQYLFILSLFFFSQHHMASELLPNSAFPNIFSSNKKFSWVVFGRLIFPKKKKKKL
jgi:hypothetical protein